MIGMERYKAYINKAGVAMAMLILALTSLSTAWAGEEERRVFDQAELFGRAEVKELEDEIQKARSVTKMDLAVVTTTDAEGKSPSEYAEGYYLNAGFGVGYRLDGALFLIDMDNRDIYLLTSGRMANYLPDWREDRILDDARAKVKDGDYYHAVDIFLKDVVSYYKTGRAYGDSYIREDTGERGLQGYQVVQTFVFAGIVAGICCWRVNRKYGMVKEKQQGQTPLMVRESSSKLVLSATIDQLLEENVVQTEKSDDSKRNRHNSVPMKRTLPHNKEAGASGAARKGVGGRKF